MLPSKLLAPVIAASLLLTAASARADDATTASAIVDEPTLDAPKSHYPPASVRLKLAIGGLAVTGIAYAAAYGVTSNWPEVPGSEYLKAPVVGPWMALGKSGCASDDPRCDTSKIVLRGILYVIDGIAQLGGLGLIGEAIFMKTEPEAATKKPAALGPRRTAAAPAALTIRPYPMLTPNATGLGVIGTF